MGLRMIARPSATRWRCPPLSCSGYFFNWSVIPRRLATRETSLVCSALVAPRIRIGKPRFVSTVM